MKHKLAAFIIIILLLAGLFYFNPGLLDIINNNDYQTGISPGNINYQKTQTYGNMGCGLGGCWAGYTDSTSPELITDASNTPLVTAFKPSSDSSANYPSETVTIQGAIIWTGGCLSLRTWQPTYDWYRISEWNGASFSTILLDKGTSDTSKIHILSGGIDWRPINIGYDWCWENKVAYKSTATTFQLLGPYVGALKVDYFARFDLGILGTEDHVMETDYIYCISGVGTINIPSESYEIGEKVPISYETGYSGIAGLGDDTGWYIRALPLANNAKWQPKVITSPGQIKDGSAGTVQFTVTPEMWFCGIDNPQVKFELWNPLFPQSSAWIKTIDLKSNAPPAPALVVSSNKIHVGDSVTVSGTCSVPATSFIVYAEWTDNRNVRFFENDNTPSSGSSFSIEIPSSYIQREGTFIIFADTVDACGRASLNAASIQVQVKYPGEPFAKPDIALVVAIIIVIIGGLIALFVPTKDYRIKILIFLIFVGIAVAVYYFVDFNPVTDWLYAQWWYPK